jgi:hypothetical protein
LVNFVNAEIDFGLFLRPFTTHSWIAILAVLFCLFLPFIMSRTVLKVQDAEDLAATRILAFISWTFMLLVNSYYGGALTMFFTSAAALPFTTVAEGLKMYPDWKMVTIAGL